HECVSIPADIEESRVMGMPHRVEATLSPGDIPGRTRWTRWIRPKIYFILITFSENACSTAVVRRHRSPDDSVASACFIHRNELPLLVRQENVTHSLVLFGDEIITALGDVTGVPDHDFFRTHPLNLFGNELFVRARE